MSLAFSLSALIVMSFHPRARFGRRSAVDSLAHRRGPADVHDRRQADAAGDFPRFRRRRPGRFGADLGDGRRQSLDRQQSLFRRHQAKWPLDQPEEDELERGKCWRTRGMSITARPRTAFLIVLASYNRGPSGDFMSLHISRHHVCPRLRSRGQGLRAHQSYERRLNRARRPLGRRGCDRKRTRSESPRHATGRRMTAASAGRPQLRRGGRRGLPPEQATPTRRSTPKTRIAEPARGRQRAPQSELHRRK